MAQNGQDSGEERNRNGSLNMRIDGRIKYLAEVAARYKEVSLAEFIETALSEALSAERMFAEEQSSETKARQIPLWGEGLWDEDEATRMFLLATTYPELLSRPQMKLWTLLSGSMLKVEKKITLKRFVEWYDSPGLDTKHLKATSTGAGQR